MSRSLRRPFPADYIKDEKKVGRPWMFSQRRIDRQEKDAAQSRGLEGLKMRNRTFTAQVLRVVCPGANPVFATGSY
jgi:hypothetical protein